MPATSTARSSSGTNASSHVRPDEAADETDEAAAACSGVTAGRLCPEESHPPELRELALVRVEHEIARIAERRFENRPFTLAQHHGVGVVRDVAAGTRSEHVEEHAVQVEAVDQIELGEVDQVDTHETA